MKIEKILKEDKRHKQLTYEYILPDYEGTLKRVMMTDARVMRQERSLLGGELLLCGEVAFTMLYQTAEDTLQSLHFEVPYDFSFAVSGTADTHLDRVFLSTYSILPSGPRRILAKAEVVATVTDMEMYEVPVVESDEGRMTLCENHTYHTHLFSKQEAREYAEEIYSCEGVEPKVLYRDVNVALTECRPMKDGAVVSGVCKIRALLSEQDKVMPEISAEIPFEEFIPLGETLPEKTFLECDLSLVSFSLDMQNEEGVHRLIANPTISFFVRATKENAEDFVVDAYATECEIHSVYETLPLVREYAPIHHKQRLECRLPKTEADPAPMKSILFARSDGIVVECTQDREMVYLLLKLSHSILGVDTLPTDATEEGEDMRGESPVIYVRQKAESTHALNVPVHSGAVGCACRMTSFTISSPEIFEEEDAFLLCLEVSFSLTLYDETKVSVIVSTENTSPNYEKEKDTVYITFPDAGDTLWQIAKENHAHIPTLLSLNPELTVPPSSYNSPTSLSSVHRIILP